MDLTTEEQKQIENRVAPIIDRLATHEGSLPEREEALALMLEWTPSPSLRGHMLAVEASMAAYARKYGDDEALYRITGLLHDFDYEKHPTASEHPLVGVEVLLEMGFPKNLIEAVLGHADHTGVPRQTRLAKTLFAVDELTGFLTAVAYVRPTGLAGLKYKSFKKKYKTPSFAAGVDRAEVGQGVAELGVDMVEHVMFLSDALQAAFPDFPQIPEAEG